MENFQLYRTNHLLSGQFKWDILLGISNTELRVDDLQFSPISENIPHVHKSSNNLLNTHFDNIKSYFKENEGHFYTDGLYQNFIDSHPVIVDTSNIIDAYSNIYDMGMRRAKRYHKYNKQFEYFCPLWIEKLSKDSILEFKFSIGGIGSMPITSKTLKINLSDDSKFSKYVVNYIENTGLNRGDDSVINISFDNNDCAISGINVRSGECCTVKDQSICGNLKEIERPLMETDNAIIKLFSNNDMIAKQLINFNFCFNMMDFLSNSMEKLLNGVELTVSLDVYIDGEKLEKRDFYTNYEFIDKESIGESKQKINVLDYLKDYNYLELIDKNKFCQSICHWSLVGNNEYIFNVYEGFSGITNENKNNKEFYHINYHGQGNFPSFIAKTATNNNCADKWLNTVEVKYWDIFYSYIYATNVKKHEGTYVYKNMFINNIKYSGIVNNTDDPMYLIGMYATKRMFNKIKNAINNRFNLPFVELKNDEILIAKKDDLVFIVTTSRDNLAISNFRKEIYNYMFHHKVETLKDVLDVLYNMMIHMIPPTVVTFNHGLNWINVNGPSIESAEINYIKTKSNNFVFRYDGKIKPTFTKIDDSFNNIFYYKEYLHKDELKDVSNVYVKYNKNYKPVYPSINYCGIKKLENVKYNKLPFINTSLHSNEIPVLNDIEYSWFDSNKVINLYTSLEFIDVTVSKESSIEEVLKMKLKEIYNVFDDNVIDYIYSKYETNIDFEYDGNNINKLIYKVTLTLK